MTTSVIQREGFPKIVFIKGIPLYHRSGENPLDPTTLNRNPLGGGREGWREGEGAEGRAKQAR